LKQAGNDGNAGRLADIKPPAEDSHTAICAFFHRADDFIFFCDGLLRAHDAAAAAGMADFFKNIRFFLMKANALKRQKSMQARHPCRQPRPRKVF
jgi:hypothetical protein